MLETLLLLAVPAAMLMALVLDAAQTGLLMFTVVLLALALFFAGYEASRPALRQIMPVLVLAALAAAGRILFAPVPDFKPLSAIAIIAGGTLGRRNGFMVGALAALASNVFFGQGMWTPWQMYAWGLIGYLGGVFADAGIFTGRDGHVRKSALIVFGVFAGLLYGAILNSYGVLGFIHPLTWEGALAYFLASLPFDLIHGLATALFLVVLYGPWTRRIVRVVRKHGLRGESY